MTDKINYKLFKPFGSTLAKATLPLELMKDFKEDLQQIRKDEKKKLQHDWGKRLVGHVSEEYLISPEVMMKWKKAFFDPIIASYTNAHYKEDKIERILINSAWYVISKPNDFNPCHRHTEYIKGNYHLSCVGYLQIPTSMKPTDNAKSHNDFSGNTEFIEGSEGMFTDVNYRVVPNERDWILFPNSLTHLVYPFNSNDNEERISFSFNALFAFCL
jgi:hypothetical protein